MNVWQILEKRASEDTILLYFEDETISHSRLEKNVNKVANLLYELKVEKANKVALMMPNHPDFIYTWLGISKLGGITVPINIYLKGRMLRDILNHCDATTIIIDSKLRDRYLMVKDQIPRIKTEVWWKEGTAERSEALGLAFSEVYSKSSNPPPPVDIYDDDLMSIVYTSGTTGRSEGVMLYHKSYHAMARRS